MTRKKTISDFEVKMNITDQEALEAIFAQRLAEIHADLDDIEKWLIEITEDVKITSSGITAHGLQKPNRQK